MEDFNNNQIPAWCPGCGNWSILNCIKRALAELEIPPHKVLMISGIGQAAKAPHYFKCNLFNGLYGRDIPATVGAKIANKNLIVICESGDGNTYGEGGNHCVTFNKINTFQWYRERVYTDIYKAFEKALEWGDKIPIGVIYKNERPTFEDLLPQLQGEPFFPMFITYNSKIS